MSVKRHGFDDNIMEFAVRFSDLRHSNDRGGERVKSFQQISDEIFAKTGVYISHTQLSKYRNMEDGDKRLIYPKVTQILAIASYYDVSVEYLLGLTDSKRHEDKYKVGSTEFGLSETTMDLLVDSVKHCDIPFPEKYSFDMMDYNNHVIEEIGARLLPLIISYLRVSMEIDKCRKDTEGVPDSINQELKDLDEKLFMKERFAFHEFETMFKSLCKKIEESSQKKRQTKMKSAPYPISSYFYQFLK